MKISRYLVKLSGYRVQNIGVSHADQVLSGYRVHFIGVSRALYRGIACRVFTKLLI